MSNVSSFDVLVTGAEEHQGLAVIRSLGRGGFRVLAAGADPKSFGFRSRFARGSLTYPSPHADTAAFADTIANAVMTHRIPMVLPVTESSVIALDEHRERLEGITKIALAPKAMLHDALDKRRTLEIAQRLGIPVPRSIHPTSANEALAFAEDVGFPVVIKPAAQNLFAGTPGRFDFKVEYVRDRTAFVARMKGFETSGAFPLVQQYCPGIKVGHPVLVAHGKVLGLYQYKGVREHPLTGGISSLYESMRVDPQLEQWTRVLLGEMKWDGVAMPEYKFDIATGRSVLMELNGRFCGAIAGPIKVGMDFPMALANYVLNGDVTPMAREYPVGVQCRFLRADLEGLRQLWDGRTTSYLQPLPSVRRNALSVLAGFDPRVQSDTMDYGDPIPGIADTLRVSKAYGYEVAGGLLRALKLRK